MEINLTHRKTDNIDIGDLVSVVNPTKENEVCCCLVCRDKLSVDGVSLLDVRTSTIIIYADNIRDLVHSYNIELEAKANTLMLTTR